MQRIAALLSFSLFALALSQPSYALRFKDGQVLLDQLEDYDNCQGKDYTGEWCQDALVRWVKDHPADAFKAGKMTRLKMNHWAAIPFFAQAFTAKKGDCKDEDVKLAVISAVDLPADSNKKIVDAAKDIAFNKCFAQMKAPLLEAATMDSYAFKNTCKELLAKGALTGMKKTKCEKGEG